MAKEETGEKGDRRQQFRSFLGPIVGQLSCAFLTAPSIPAVSQPSNGGEFLHPKEAGRGERSLAAVSLPPCAPQSSWNCMRLQGRILPEKRLWEKWVQTCPWVGQRETSCRAPSSPPITCAAPYSTFSERHEILF